MISSHVKNLENNTPAFLDLNSFKGGINTNFSTPSFKSIHLCATLKRRWYNLGVQEIYDLFSF